jgi:hypothetical protein
MITSKYNFKQWLHRVYPEVQAIPVYGIPAYILTKALDPATMYEYNIQQLNNGQYIVFFGNHADEQLISWIQQLNSGHILRPSRGSTICPTTFSAFERFLERCNLKYTERVYISNQTANQILHQDKPNQNHRGNWYMYEITLPPDMINPTVPSGGGCVLIKASSTTYVSKKQRFLQHFSLMQPLYEQLVAALAQNDDDTALRLVNQYASIQFDKNVELKDLTTMKEAYREGFLSLYTRNIENFTASADDEAL